MTIIASHAIIATFHEVNLYPAQTIETRNCSVCQIHFLHKVPWLGMQRSSHVLEPRTNSCREKQVATNRIRVLA